MADIEKVAPLVLAGGSGTRLWPLSRAKMPKQFIQLFGDRSTFQQALLRVADGTLFHPPLVITNTDYAEIAQSQAAQLGIEITLALEPARRNSCAAVTAGAILCAQRDPNVLVLALAADHIVTGEEAFLSAVREAVAVARAGHIVVFGIVPNEPSSAFGYIRPGKLLGSSSATVAGFFEKPDVETARRYIDEGMLHNAGYFLFPAALLLDDVKRFEPAIHAAVRQSVEQATRLQDAIALDPECFGRAERRSLDHAVMEKTDKAAVVRAQFSFTDVGSFAAVFAGLPRDANNNHLVGSVEVLDTTGSFVHSNGRLTTVLGMRDVVVITTPHAVLVADRNASQQIKDLVALLERKYGPDAT